MGFLSGMLSPLLTATSQAVAGSQQGDIQGFLQKRKMDEEAADRALKEKMASFTMNKPSLHFDPASARVINETNATSAPIEGVKPVDKVGDAVAVANATKGIPTYGDLHPKPDQALVQTQGEDGQVVYTPRGEAAGMHAPSKAGQGVNLPAPLAAKVGQFGEMLKKASDLGTLTDNLDVTVGKSATRDLAEHGIHIPFIGTLPGSKGVGSMLQSHSPEYSQYQAALSPFILAAAHALSGARINQDQVEQIRKSIELAPGDFANKAVRAQKEKNMIDLINSIGGSLPAEAIGAQEDQMDADAMTRMKGLGYRAANRKGAAPATQRATTGASDTGGDINLGKPKPPLSQADYDAGLATHTDAEIAAHYDLSKVTRKTQ